MTKLNNESEKNMAQNIKAVSFSRVSTREQREGYSLDSQDSRITQYCERLHMPIIKIISFEESSTKGSRKQFYEVIDFVKKQKPPIAIVCDKVDRLQRSFKE